MSEKSKISYEIRFKIFPGDPIYDDLSALTSKERNRRTLAILNHYALGEASLARTLLPPFTATSATALTTLSSHDSSEGIGVEPAGGTTDSEQAVTDERVGGLSLLDDFQAVV